VLCKWTQILLNYIMIRHGIKRMDST